MKASQSSNLIAFAAERQVGRQLLSKHFASQFFALYRGEIPDLQNDGGIFIGVELAQPWHAVTSHIH